MHVDVTPKTMQSDMVYIGRPSTYENTFRVKQFGRGTACDCFEKKFVLDQRIAKAREDLRGKRLVCYCHPERCHGHFLSRVVNMDTYTGIGSRKTPTKYLLYMYAVARVLENNGYMLYSGGAEGADTAFFNGVHDKIYTKIFLPWNGFNGLRSQYTIPDQAVEIARTLHPVFDSLSQGTQKLHSRNVQQILGHDLHHPTNFVVCYTDDGVETADKVTSKTGGTGTAIKLASLHGIPVFNLRNKDAERRLSLYTGIFFGHLTKQVFKSMDESPLRDNERVIS